MAPVIKKASKLPNEIKPLLALVAFVLVPALLLTACGGDDSSTSGSPGGSSSAAKLNVVATTVQITALAHEVGGDRIDLSGLIQPGADPHTFEPTASDLTKIEGADAILRHSLGLDDWLDGTLQAGAHAQVVTVTGGITPLKSEENGATVDDPHVWHDPDNDKIMVDNIAAALDRADPINKPAYDANAAAYKKKLDDTKAQVQSIINEIPPDNRKLVTNHDALGYFARAFGLQVVGAVIPSVSTEAEPSAQETAALLDTISREHVKAIFAESSVNPKLATTLANDAGVKIVDDLYGDSLGAPGSGADTVDGMLVTNARKIANALK
ncbi:MAG: metal ABC transporter substrate-binding protein [Chloroflexota bacterium]|nr:metal ABC transporter substrate-binding protein [Chloroflexota bacterium]